MSRYIIGFDADTDKCGISILDTVTGKYKLKTESYNKIIGLTMPSFIELYGTSDVVVRIEVPTFETAIGVSKRFKFEKKERRIFNSGKCSGIADQFLAYCRSIPFYTVEVRSQHRVRCDSKGYEGKTAQQLQEEAIGLRMHNRYLSKLDLNRAAKIFTESKHMTEESIDAALLFLPELSQYRKNKQG